MTSYRGENKSRNANDLVENKHASLFPKTKRKFMSIGRSSRKGKRAARENLYFLKKPPSWSIMLLLLPLWEGGPP